jgi:succinate-acetate transporter protein
MVVESARITVEDRTGNLAPVGLLAFGLTTVLLNLHNAGLFGLDAMILSMGIFYGGAAQVISGIMEWRKGNTFATTVFMFCGFFWFPLAGLLMFPKVGLGTTSRLAAMAAYQAIWGAFTGVMFIGKL